MAGRPDPKPAPRVVDSEAMATAKRVRPYCEACGAGPFINGLSAHHVMLRSRGGDDLLENLLTFCGDGVLGCHGGAHAKRRSTLKRIRFAIEARPDVMDYLERKLGGPIAVSAWLDRNYPKKEKTRRSSNSSARRTCRSPSTTTTAISS